MSKKVSLKSDHDMWTFSAVHLFPDERKTFVKRLNNRTDLSQLFYAVSDFDHQYVTKGLIWFDRSVTKTFAESVVMSNDGFTAFPVSDWDKSKITVSEDKRFATTHTVHWIDKLVKPSIPRPSPLRLKFKLPKRASQLKGLEFIKDDDCANCGA